MDLQRYQNAELTYEEAGATGSGDLPGGYRHLRRRYDLGEAASFRGAAEALLTWRMHAALGLRPQATAPRAAPGVVVVSRLGPGPLALKAPCRVVWAIDEDRRAGFAYGTLPGHPESGEESFLLEVADDGSLSFTISAFTRPGRWYTRLAGPITAMAQRVFADRYAAALRHHTR
ncbi:DUF1990 domain-containing protein [Planotetraspora phitsanulokensis]|uniref:DUF1990 domain-containing protein n=1 Tax=Planotetraspora phitsanulokensis TaxID=575192 RepID=A0A8J3XHC1_9ACTN|nr:DUF1990 domain-containing protein [Planotetraspora phitsanulokensis]GII36408.1 DUF1990 domain-containing protein [Planotetraspora phitsanulokensis]